MLGETDGPTGHPRARQHCQGGAGLAQCRAWWGGHAPQLWAPWSRGCCPCARTFPQGCGTGLRHMAGSHRSAQGHAAEAAAGRGQRWVRARGAGARGMEVLMLLIIIDLPGSSAYRWLPSAILRVSSALLLQREKCWVSGRCLRLLPPAHPRPGTAEPGCRRATECRREHGHPDSPSNLRRQGRPHGRCPCPSARTGLWSGWGAQEQGAAGRSGDLVAHRSHRLHWDLGGPCVVLGGLVHSAGCI